MKDPVFDDDHGIFIREGTCDGLVRDEIFKDKIYLVRGFEIGKGFLVIDIGGHIGAFSVYAAREATDGKVFCYEPENGNFTLLNKNLKINDLKNVLSFNCAVLDKKGTAELFIEKNKTSGYSLYLPGAEHVRVDTISLKDIFDENKINFCDFLKIDAEGAEHAILVNLPAEYFRRIGAMVLEYHEYIIKNDAENLVKLLSGRGFKVEVITPSSYVFGVGLIFARRSGIGRRRLFMSNYMKYVFLKPRGLLALIAGLLSGKTLKS